MGRFRPIVYSAMRGPNLLTLLKAIDLVPEDRRTPYVRSTRFHHLQNYEGYDPDLNDGDVLSLVLSRETMGLTEEEYEGDVQTCKDLSKVWDGLDLGTEGAADGVDALNAALAGITLAGRGGASASAEEKGARCTVLLDDEEEAAVRSTLSFSLPRRAPVAALMVDVDFFVSLSQAQFPYSLLKVKTFTPYSELQSPSHHGPNRFLPAVPVDLPSEHPDSHDTHLLTLIYLLSLLRYETNISAALRSGFIDNVRSRVRSELSGGANDEDVEKEMAEKGKKVCEEAGVEVRKGWNYRWREELLEKEEKV